MVLGANGVGALKFEKGWFVSCARLGGVVACGLKEGEVLPQKKRCSECEETKDAFNFSRDRSKRDGRDPRCKNCCSRRARREKAKKAQRKYNRTEKARKRVQRYRETEKGQATLKAYQQSESSRKKINARRKIRREMYPERHEAHKKVYDAVRKGILVRSTICGLANKNCKGQIEGHHPNYSKALEVVWLCRYHHCLIERLKGRGRGHQLFRLVCAKNEKRRFQALPQQFEERSSPRDEQRTHASSCALADGDCAGEVRDYRPDAQRPGETLPICKRHRAWVGRLERNLSYRALKALSRSRLRF